MSTRSQIFLMALFLGLMVVVSLLAMAFDFVIITSTTQNLLWDFVLVTLLFALSFVVSIVLYGLSAEFDWLFTEIVIAPVVSVCLPLVLIKVFNSIIKSDYFRLRDFDVTSIEVSNDGLVNFIIVGLFSFIAFLFHKITSHE